MSSSPSSANILSQEPWPLRLRLRNLRLTTVPPSSLPESEYNGALAEASSVVAKFKQVVIRYSDDYRRAVETADEALEEALVRFYSRGRDGRDNPKVASARQRAESSHRGALEQALAYRRLTLSRDFPVLRSALLETEARCYSPPDDRIYGGWQSADSVVAAIRTYKANREPGRHRAWGLR